MAAQHFFNFSYCSVLLYNVISSKTVVSNGGITDEHVGKNFEVGAYGLIKILSLHLYGGLS
jgi:hypothetical protein